MKNQSRSKETLVERYIRKSTSADLPYLMKMYEDARVFMRENGNPDQWGASRPQKEQIESDITAGDSYVCEENGKIIGTFFFKRGADPTYAVIYEGEWMSDEPYGVVHRITTDRESRGTASFCLQWAIDQAGGHLRIDTHEDNKPMQGVLKKNGFTCRGIIYLADGSSRMAYEVIR